MLGECQSKCEHLTKTPILPEIRDELQQVYLAKGSRATTAIEGNTLSEEEVLKHIRGELHLPRSREYLAREIDNVISACNRLSYAAAERRIPDLSVEEIATLNHWILDGLPFDDHVEPGKIRQVTVGVGNYRAAPPEDCEYLLERLCEWLNGDHFDSLNETPMINAIIKAILAHLYVAWIHPFGDGNGRTSRLLEFRILLTSGIPAPAAHLLSNHYNQTRTEYYRQLSQATASGGDVVPFLTYAVQGFLDGLKEQVDKVHEQQWNVVWRDHVYRSFKGRSSESKDRRRRLVFALTERVHEVTISEIPELNVKLMKMYFQKTPKTVTRDVNALVEMGLVVKKGQKVRAKFEAISGFQCFAAGS